MIGAIRSQGLCSQEGANASRSAVLEAHAAPTAHSFARQRSMHANGHDTRAPRFAEPAAYCSKTSYVPLRKRAVMWLFMVYVVWVRGVHMV